MLFICYSIVEFNFALETFGVNSHCIEHNSRWRVQTVTGKSVQSSSWGAGCYNVSCLHIHCSCRYCNNVYNHSQTFTKQLLDTHIQAIQYVVNTAHALAIAAWGGSSLVQNRQVCVAWGESSCYVVVDVDWSCKWYHSGEQSKDCLKQLTGVSIQNTL